MARFYGDDKPTNNKGELVMPTNLDDYGDRYTGLDFHDLTDINDRVDWSIHER